MIRYSDVENLPHDHPLYQAFLLQEATLDDAYDSVEDEVQEEDSLHYFNRYIAGDK